MKVVAASVPRQVLAADDLASTVATDLPETQQGEPSRRLSGAQGRGSRQPLTSATLRPHLIICNDLGARGLGAAILRLSRPGSRMLLRADRAPRRWHPLARLVLAWTDAVVVDQEVVARALRRLGIAASRIVLARERGDLALFACAPVTRAPDEARRIIHAGPLEPETGAADLLGALAAWAERHPDRVVEIWWAGDGCLRVLLEAQPAPPNLVQRFLGGLTRQELAAAFAQCGMLVVPALAELWTDFVAEALASGLPVLGSSLSRTAGEFVTDGETGWIFDPLRPGEMDRALALALDTPAEALDRMRCYTRARISAAAADGLEVRIRRALGLGQIAGELDLAALGASR